LRKNAKGVARSVRARLQPCRKRLITKQGFSPCGLLSCDTTENRPFSVTCEALLASRAEAKGYSISVADCQIAAIVAVHGFAVATRDTAPFLAAGVPFINPWEG
jgi:hypothetical protein